MPNEEKLTLRQKRTKAAALKAARKSGIPSELAKEIRADMLELEAEGFVERVIDPQTGKEGFKLTGKERLGNEAKTGTSESEPEEERDTSSGKLESAIEWLTRKLGGNPHLVAFVHCEENHGPFSHIFSGYEPKTIDGALRFEGAVAFDHDLAEWAFSSAILYPRMMTAQISTKAGEHPPELTEPIQAYLADHPWTPTIWVTTIAFQRAEDRDKFYHRMDFDMWRYQAEDAGYLHTERDEHGRLLVGLTEKGQEYARELNQGEADDALSTEAGINATQQLEGVRAAAERKASDD